MYGCDNSFQLKNNCKLKIDSDYLRKHLSTLKPVDNRNIISLLGTYEDSFLEGISDSGVNKNNIKKSDIYFLNVNEFNNNNWRFFVKKENTPDSLLNLKMFLITKDKPTINDIIELTHIISDDKFGDKLNSCLTDTGIITTHVIKYGSDLIIDGMATTNYDSVIHTYIINKKGALALKEQNTIRRYDYH